MAICIQPTSVLRPLTVGLGPTSVIGNGVSDSGGNTLWKDLYAPFSDLRYHWDSTPGFTQTDYRYTGQRFDENLVGGLYDYIARCSDYAPWQGRFLQPDTTIVLELGNPQALNRYNYANNNPFRYRDPKGYTALSGDDYDPADVPNDRKFEYYAIAYAPP